MEQELRNRAAGMVLHYRRQLRRFKEAYTVGTIEYSVLTSVGDDYSSETFGMARILEGRTEEQLIRISHLLFKMAL